MILFKKLLVQKHFFLVSYVITHSTRLIYYIEKGFTKDEIIFILDEVKSLNNSPQRNKLQALVIYLFWLKTGIAQDLIACYFGLNDRRFVGHLCDQVRTALNKDFCPNHLGSSHLNRDSWISKNTVMAKSVFDLNPDQFCFICDGTYCYCEKSCNNYVQRICYSGQKYRHLVKPFVISSTNGTIIDVYGPFTAVDNDASILTSILKTDKNLRDLIMVRIIL